MLLVAINAMSFLSLIKFQVGETAFCEELIK